VLLVALELDALQLVHILAKLLLLALDVFAEVRLQLVEQQEDVVLLLHSTLVLLDVLVK